MRGGEGQEIQRAPAGMVIQHDVGQRHQFGGDVMRNLLGYRAAGAARKAAVHIAAVDG